MVDQGRAELIRGRESFDDVVRLDEVGDSLDPTSSEPYHMFGEEANN